VYFVLYPYLNEVCDCCSSPILHKARQEAIRKRDVYTCGTDRLWSEALCLLKKGNVVEDHSFSQRLSKAFVLVHALCKSRASSSSATNSVEDTATETFF
jgi:hypothetical protein